MVGMEVVETCSRKYVDVPLSFHLVYVWYVHSCTVDPTTLGDLIPISPYPLPSVRLPDPLNETYRDVADAYNVDIAG